MAKDTVTTNELLEFMKDNMVTKEDAKSFATKDDLFEIKEDIKDIKANMATKDDLRTVKDDLTGLIDGLTKNFNRHDSEICALRSRCSRIERHVGM